MYWKGWRQGGGTWGRSRQTTKRFRGQQPRAYKESANFARAGAECLCNRLIIFDDMDECERLPTSVAHLYNYGKGFSSLLWSYECNFDLPPFQPGGGVLLSSKMATPNVPNEVLVFNPFKTSLPPAVNQIRVSAFNFLIPCVLRKCAGTLSEHRKSQSYLRRSTGKRCYQTGYRGHYNIDAYDLRVLDRIFFTRTSCPAGAKQKSAECRCMFRHCCANGRASLSVPRRKKIGRDRVIFSRTSSLLLSISPYTFFAT